MESGRVVGIVALCAAAAVAGIVGGTVLLSRNERTTLAGRSGTPVLQLELGLRQDAEAVALRQAQKLLDANDKPAQAAAIFRRYSSVEARLGLAFSQWTGSGSLGTVQSIAASYPRSPAAQLNLGWAYYWAGRQTDATAQWQQTASRFPDSPYAVDALDALNPAGHLAGLPYILVDPTAVSGKARADLKAGVRFWDLKEMVSARRLLDAAARLAPRSPETLVAAAVARYSAAQPKAPFPLLGPLTATFPNASIVRFHLGLLLFWTHQLAKGEVQLRLATVEEPTSIYAKQARRLLRALGQK